MYFNNYVFVHLLVHIKVLQNGYSAVILCY